MRCYSSCSAAGVTVVGKIADAIVALIPANPAAFVSLNQTAGRRDERLVAALRSRLGSVPLSVLVTRYEPQPNEALWFEVDVTVGAGVVAAWSAEVYVVGCAVPAPRELRDAHTRRLEAQVRALSDDLRRRAREIRALSDTLRATESATQKERRACERQLRAALDANEELAGTVAGLVQLNTKILAKSRTLAAEYTRVSRALGER